ncbi:hypothetical protein BWZ22_03680 [Seonamhaeicola sp. S2-3]|uniref:tetratricopeptide repeat protein n=1 Tax=Seonamhaeicola sp. S2-3 TaxID=1936081 RepID=UPI000972D1EC|nr:tetratricopeptide repeat protein [Seonamhaeicola sp. S2-3]APY10394.1 hypothetical protein BWZ22_03680 [Seonamhaeicola sp. S2-3]
MNKFLLILLMPFIAFSQLNFEKVKELIKDKQYDEAEQILKNYVDTNANNIQAVELLGDVYGHQKKWDEAIIQYKKLVKAKPENANFHYKYGGVLGMKALSVNKFKALTIIDDVKAAFLKAAELDSNHIDTRWALVELYMKLPGIIGGSKSKALHYANELEALSKVDGYLSKGYIYESDKEPQQAEKYYKMAVNKGGSLVCYDKLTKFYLAQNLPEKAISNLNEAYKKHKNEDLLLQIEAIKANNY